MNLPTILSPLATYVATSLQLTHFSLIALTFFGCVSAAHATPDIEKLESSIVLKGSGATDIDHSMKPSRLLDVAYSTWAWTHLKTHEEVMAELAKYEAAYTAFQKASDTEYDTRWDIEIKHTPTFGWAEKQWALRARVDRELFLQSPDQDAIARYHDLALLKYRWGWRLTATAPWHAEDWAAFETFYCKFHSEYFNPVMGESCTLPNWRRPDAPETHRYAYERRKRKGLLEFLKTE
ncbi:hypothetical protein ACQU0X_31630 [Pseudovibrio ascidiaceicola]|uniref:hypothetical protein n=1 Tax=Pseudovibrio ascidiaceicola TaxID=285279 RepID=UPI003D36D0CB